MNPKMELMDGAMLGADVMGKYVGNFIITNNKSVNMDNMIKCADRISDVIQDLKKTNPNINSYDAYAVSVGACAPQPKYTAVVWSFIGCMMSCLPKKQKIGGMDELEKTPLINLFKSVLLAKGMMMAHKQDLKISLNQHSIEMGLV